MADVVKYTTNELMKDESYQTFLYVLAHKKEYEDFEKKFKQALLTEMKEQGITNFENDHIKVTYKAPSIRKVVDTDALREQGLYDFYVKESKVSESVSISVK